MITPFEAFVNENLVKIIVWGIVALIGIGAAVIGMAGGAE